jgi:ABC-type nitrate/sulfonate/bicarbonate transport system permease component
VVFPYLVILAIFGFTMDFSLRWLQRKTCPWFVPEESR